MRRKPLHYGFEYSDGIGTTTGGNNGSKLHIYGHLMAFRTIAERDAWVARGHDSRGGRVAVTARGLPYGWTLRDACIQLDGRYYADEVWTRHDAQPSWQRFDD